MNRNSNYTFSEAPSVSISRSRFDRSSCVKTSFNVGELIPFFVEEVLPGDTFEIDTGKLIRMQTLKTPMMDNLYLDTYYFFVPNRLVWSHWRNFMGENTESAWIPSTEYSVPQISAPSGGWSTGSIADYMGIPIGVDDFSINALPIRAYALICNEWFRDENNSDPLVWEFGDSTVAGSNGSTFVTDVGKAGKPYLAAKTHDYFTSCLPAPQKGPDVQVSAIGNKTVPVYTQGTPNSHYLVDGYGLPDVSKYKSAVGDAFPLQFEFGDIVDNGSGTLYPNFFATQNKKAGSDHTIKILTNSSNQAALANTISSQSVINKSLDDFPSTSGAAVPVNLVADNSLVYTSINELRQAFQIQRFYERAARGGSRYIELIKSHFGVTSPDARMMRPEYLGGNRLPINIRQVTQNSSTSGSDYLGNVAGMSVTGDKHYDFVKSFTEHGFIIGLCVARYDHTYQQGLERFWSRSSMFDFYFPEFAHLGEMAVKNKEIYLQGTSTDNEVFGYQEAWADYRYKPNRVSGMMRSESNTSLDTWHLGDDYSSLPYLSSSWIMEDKAPVDRVLRVSSTVSNQIFADFFIRNKATRPMPLYSIPGLIDHV